MWQPNYLKLPMCRTAPLRVRRGNAGQLVLRRKGVCPLARGDRRKLVRYPRNFDGLSSILPGNRDAMGAPVDFELRKDLHARTQTRAAPVRRFNSNQYRVELCPRLVRSNVERVLVASLLKARLQRPKAAIHSE